MSKWTKAWLLAAVASLLAVSFAIVRDVGERGGDAGKASAGHRGRAGAPALRAPEGIEATADGGGGDWAGGGAWARGDGAGFESLAPEGEGAYGPLSQYGAAEGGGRSNRREPPIFAQLRNSKNVPISRRVRELSDEITKGETNAVSKARAIYDWMTRNIVYDTAEWESIASGAQYYIHDHDPDSVLERGTTVCIGYAWLFDDLCEAAGIEATWLIGDVRGYRGTPDDAIVSDVRHAWNAVRLEDGEWHLLDATWGAFQEGEKESAMSDARADYYFDTPPGQFVFDHLPENEEWQLLEEAVPSATAFSVLPNLKPAFFTNGLKLGGDYTSVLKAKAGTSPALTFSAPDGVQTAATVGSASDPESFGRVRVVKAPDDGGLAAVLPELPAGEYVLRLYSGASSSGMLECSADFLIRAE